MRQMALFNHALLAKRLWHNATKNDAFWCRVVESKYDSDWSGWCSKEGRGGVWCLFMEVHLCKMESFFKVCLISVGQGTKVPFGSIGSVGMTLSRMPFDAVMEAQVVTTSQIRLFKNYFMGPTCEV